MNENDLFFMVEKRLIEFGYPKDSIQFEFKTPLGRRADVVVFEDDKPKIVIEIKGGNISLPEKDSELKFHPATRQAQAYAKELKASYFAVTNGLVFRWFTTDDDGRPKLLQHPIYLASITSEDSSMEKNKILQVLFGLADISRGSLSFDSMLNNLAVALLSHLENDGNQQYINKTDDFSFLDINKLDQEFLANAHSTFAQADIRAYSGSVLVQAIDEFLQLSLTDIRLAQFKLPVWLTNFMVDLAKVETSKGFLDIYSNFGDGIVAAHRISQNIPVYSFSFISLAFLWDRVKRAALKLSSNDAWFVSTSSMSKISLSSRIDRVLVAPPFGGRISNDNQQTQSSEVFYLEKALSLIEDTGFIVAIVPENFLFSESQDRFRFTLLEQCRLWAIISLEQFLPKTGIKANILVLEKQNIRKLGNVLMAELTTAEIKQISSKSRANRLREILDFHNAHLIGQTPSANEQIVLVSEEELFGNKSWSVRRYLTKDSESIAVAYPTRNLSELCEITKGANITLDGDGDLPIIGPSAVRAFYIDPISFDKTSKKKIALAKTNPKQIKQNDILIHAIGPHRGEAALVPSEFDGYLISRHMLIADLITQEIIPEYLVIALNSSYVRKQVYNLSTGTVIAGLTSSNVRDLAIPLPPIDEQKRIVEKVKSIRYRLSQIQNNLRDTEGELEALLDDYYTLGANNG
jgi:hypothetical protein